jgi:hypothetical protein
MLSLDEWTDDNIGLDAGYMTTIVAGLWPSLVTGLVLLNTAGRVIPDYKALTYNKPKEKSVIAKPFSQLLMLYLQTFSDRLLTRCYPNVRFLPPSFTLSAAQT